MWAYTEDETRWLETPKVQAERQVPANVRLSEVDYYIDAARRARAAVIANLFRKATNAAVRSLHLTPASQGAKPRAV
jgi:hypothetical protein